MPSFIMPLIAFSLYFTITFLWDNKVATLLLDIFHKRLVIITFIRKARTVLPCKGIYCRTWIANFILLCCLSLIMKYNRQPQESTVEWIFVLLPPRPCPISFGSPLFLPLYYAFNLTHKSNLLVILHKFYKLTTILKEKNPLFMLYGKLLSKIVFIKISFILYIFTNVGQVKTMLVCLNNRRIYGTVF